MKRPILIATIGYIIGIIWGIYFKFSIFLFYIFIVAMYYLIKTFFNSKRKFKILSIKRYFRYLKLYITKKSFILIVLISTFSNIVVNYNNAKYENIYNKLNVVETKATVVSEKIDKQYNNVYKVKIENKYFYVYINKNISLEYGDIVNIKGNYEKPSIQRNYNGFDYSKYLKSKKIYGIIKCNNIKKINKNNSLYVFKFFSDLKLQLKNIIAKNMPRETSTILDGIILGDTSNIDDEVKDNFRVSNISHILAISGMHISYIIIGINLISKKILGARKSKYVNIIILLIYIFLVGFSPSISRAGIMGLLTIISNMVYRKSDTLTNIGFSALLLLLYNPYIIFDLGFQYSYVGTLGIVLFNNNIFGLLKQIKNKRKKSIFDNKIGKGISVILSAQIFILVISILNSHYINPYFIITNVLTSVIIGPIIIIGILYIFLLLINIHIAGIIGIPLNFLIKVLLLISNFSSLPFSKIYITKFNVIFIIIYFVTIFMFQIFYIVYISKKQSQTLFRLKNTIALIKYILKPKFKIIKTTICVFIMVLLVINVIPKDLKIYFIDVGQGDSTFIVTPQNKTILIDGGGSTNSNFDVGKSTLLPYILSRGYSKIDYVIISHFDDDHCGGVFSVLKELNIKQVIIGKQFESSENYEKFLNIVKQKNIKVNVVDAGQKINIEENLLFEIIWPNSNNIINENKLNNNSLVCKLKYKNFSMLFTGDIEEIAETEILKRYSNILNELSSTVLKVAHHGSKTSSLNQLLKSINPKYACIGVGKDNKFGHPSDITIEKLKGIECKIYRTDYNGEIVIKTNGNKIQINKFIKEE